MKMIVKNLEKDNIVRPHKFDLDLTFKKDGKDKFKILDDLKNQTVTDDVIRIDKSTVDDFKIIDKNDSNVDDDSKGKVEKIFAWIEKPGRKFLSVQTISHTGQVIQSHDQVVDKKQKGTVITFEPKDMQSPL